MITVNIISTLYNLVVFVLNLIPDVLTFPPQMLNSIYNFFDIIFGHLDFLGMFIRINTIVTLLPFVLIVINLEYIIKLSIWLLGKIPGLNIH